MNPGRSALRTGVLSHSRTIASARAVTCASVRAPGTTSTSDISGTGLKKWRPRTRSGRSVASAIAGDRQRARVRGEDDVRRRLGIEGPEHRPLQVEVLERRLDDECGLGRQPVEDVGVTKPGHTPVDPGVDAVGVEPELRRPAAEPVADAARRRARWHRCPRRGARPPNPPRARPGRCRRPSPRRRRCRRIVTPTSWPRTAGGTRGSRRASDTGSGRTRCPSRRPARRSTGSARPPARPAGRSRHAAARHDPAG